MSLYAVVDPTSGETVREYPTISDGDLRSAIDRAFDAYRGWSLTSTVDERVALLRRLAELHQERGEELAHIIVRETGKPLDEARSEAGYPKIYNFYADNAEQLLADEEIAIPPVPGEEPESAIVRRAPYGVLLGIMPWNYPAYQVQRFAGPNLLIGNPILLKHAPQCPESAEFIEKIFQDAGYPEGVYTNIRATNEQIEWVLADQRVRGVSLTGSQRAGRAVAEIAGRNLKKCLLELGGSDPFILLKTSALDDAVKLAVMARYENAGQGCNAGKRFIIADDLYKPFVEKLTVALGEITQGDPLTHMMGPMSSPGAADRLEDQVDRAVAAGATVVTGGKRNGNFFQPTILTDIAPDNQPAREEFFGPIWQVYPVSSEEEAIALANDTEFGLGSYVVSEDPEQAERLATQVEAGMVFVNAAGRNGAELPFGGVKGSGYGRELGRLGASEFVNYKLIRKGQTGIAAS